MSMQRLVEQGEVGGVIVRLMMVLQDYAWANRAFTALGRSGKKKKKLGDTKRAAGRYFLRLQMSHSFEALEIVREIKNSEALTGLVLGCDRVARVAFRELEQFLEHGDYVLLARIRNNLSFHYDKAGKVVLKSLARIERRRQGQVEKQKQGLPDLRKPIDSVKLTLARRPDHSQFVAWEMVETDIVLHDIFKLAESDTKTGDRQLDADADEIVMRLHQVLKQFSIFAAHFILKYAK
jgi:hypothetical protein